MEYPVLKSILTDELGGTKVDDTIEISQPRVSMVLDVGGTQPLSITRVKRVRFADKFLEIQSDEGRVFVDSDAVRAIRSEGDADRKDSRPGFHG